MRLVAFISNWRTLNSLRKLDFFQEIISQLNWYLPFPTLHVCGWSCEGLQTDVILNYHQFSAVHPHWEPSWNKLDIIGVCKAPGWRLLGEQERGGPSHRILYQSDASPGRFFYPITHSLTFPQKFLRVIHSVWFLCLPPPNHLDPIYKPQTAQECMQDLFWERLEGKCKPDKTGARSWRPPLICKVGHNCQGECWSATWASCRSQGRALAVGAGSGARREHGWMEGNREGKEGNGWTGML